MLVSKAFKSLLIAILIVSTSCQTQKKLFKADAELKPDSIFRVMEKVTKWQTAPLFNNKSKNGDRDWTTAAFYPGLLKFAEIANDDSYYQLLKNIGDRNTWSFFNDKKRYHADYYAVGQMYTRMYEIYKDPSMLKDFMTLADTLVNRPHNEPLNWKNQIQYREWAWCDALFMAPPALTMLANATDNKSYLDLSNKLWWKTTDFLYDPNSQLFFRDERFMKRKEKNGQKVFWSRGNGWVVAGITRVLEYMPEDYPDRKKLINLFQVMMPKIASLQHADGTWRTSLLDPDSYPSKEISGSAFFVYALSWGVNNNLLDKEKYAPIINKGWKALLTSVHSDGKLGNIQRISAEPGIVTEDDTENYGVGAFLLAGNEVLTMILKEKEFNNIIVVKNIDSKAKKISDILKDQKQSNIKYLNILDRKTIDSNSLIQGATTLYLKKL